ncbi:MAG TPA: hypothetical protein VN132_01420, partial [Bdellovibrio sp.]|nr:hypothetical protein [Bdellovibrio sp.]
MSFLKNILDTSLGKDFWNYRLGQMVSLLGDSCSNIALANIPIGTQITLSVPDSHLARVGSIMGFLGAGITPLGIAAAGLLISKFGLTISLVAMGGLLVLLTPLMFIIPKFAE